MIKLMLLLYLFPSWTLHYLLTLLYVIKCVAIHGGALIKKLRLGIIKKHRICVALEFQKPCHFIFMNSPSLIHQFFNYLIGSSNLKQLSCVIDICKVPYDISKYTIHITDLLNIILFCDHDVKFISYFYPSHSIEILVMFVIRVLQYLFSIAHIVLFQKVIQWFFVKLISSSCLCN